MLEVELDDEQGVNESLQFDAAGDDDDDERTGISVEESVMCPTVTCSFVV